MLLNILLFLVFFRLWKQTISTERKTTVIIILVLYTIYTLFDLTFLMSFFNFPFHPSDPSGYYLKTKDLNFNQLLVYGFENGANLFYLFINWIYNHSYNNNIIIAIYFKIANILVFLSTYLIITNKLNKFTIIDNILLFNPYVFLVLARNIRDPYIFFFVAIILVRFNVFPCSRVKFSTFIIAVILLLLTRSIMFLPIFVLWIFKYQRKYIKIWVALFLIIIFLFRNQLMTMIVGQTVSALEYYQEDGTDYEELLNFNYSFATLLLYIKRIFIGLIVFIFTPNPINYFLRCIANMNRYGSYGIYTGLDNFMIILGSIYTYLFVLPYCFYMTSHFKNMVKPLIFFSLSYAFIYTVAFLGVTDLRNHLLFFYFMLVDLVYYDKKELSFKAVKKYVALSIFLCFIIAFISSTN